MSTTAVHVYQPGNIPLYAENTPQALYVEYGKQTQGDIFRDIFIHDEEQKQWLTEEIESRLQQGGVVRYLPSPSPVSGPKVSGR
jgi:hypothetical protein